MRDAPLRIERHKNQGHLGEGGGDSGGAGKYFEAITKLIPGEVVAAYLTGRSVVQAGAPGETPGKGTWIVWTLVCLFLVIGLRKWMTSDKAAGVPAEWSAVCISALSFLVWVYSFGDVFQLLGLWTKVSSTLALITWTAAAPLILFGLKRVFRD